MTQIKIAKGVIQKKIWSTDKLDGFRTVPDSFDGGVGEPISLFDKKMTRIPIEVVEPVVDLEAAALGFEGDACQAYLFNTDWYVIRQIETGEPIPEEIKSEREFMRKRISELRREYATVSISK